MLTVRGAMGDDWGIVWSLCRGVMEGVPPNVICICDDLIAAFKTTPQVLFVAAEAVTEAAHIVALVRACRAPTAAVLVARAVAQAYG